MKWGVERERDIEGGGVGGGCMMRQGWEVDEHQGRKRRKKKAERDLYSMLDNSRVLVTLLITNSAMSESQDSLFSVHKWFTFISGRVVSFISISSGFECI